MTTDFIHARVLALEHLVFALVDATKDKATVQSQFLATSEMTHARNTFSTLPEKVFEAFQEIRTLYAQKLSELRTIE